MTVPTAIFPALFVLLWSTGFIGARYAMPYAEPFTFLLMRYGLAIALLAPLILAFRAPWPSRRIAGHAAFVGALIHGVYLGGVFLAVRNGLPAGIAALVVGLQPLIAALLSARFLSERIGVRHWCGLALGLFGIALVVYPGLTRSEGSFGATALLPALASAFAISIGTVWQKRFASRVDLRSGTLVQYLGAAAITLPAALLFETQRIVWSGELVFALLWLTVVLSLGAVFLLLYLIREGAVSKVSSLMYLTPGTTAIMAYLLFGESLSAIQLGGLAVAGIGVAFATRAPARADGRGEAPPRNPVP